jgi:hypothetical protein
MLTGGDFFEPNFFTTTMMQHGLPTSTPDVPIGRQPDGIQPLAPRAIRFPLAHGGKRQQRPPTHAPTCC